jgi:hypothetical protein
MGRAVLGSAATRVPAVIGATSVSVAGALRHRHRRRTDMHLLWFGTVAWRGAEGEAVRADEDHLSGRV